MKHETAVEWIEEELSAIDYRLEVTCDGWYYRIYDRLSGSYYDYLTWCYEEDNDIWGEWLASDGCEYSGPRGWVEWAVQHYEEERLMTSGPKLRCNKCGDVIQSMYRHDWKECSCGAVYIDGGSDYTRVGGNEEDWELLPEETEGR